MAQELSRPGGGFIGGGFGLGGAIAGMLAASVMNAATTKTEIETNVSLTATDWAVIVVYDQVEPDALRIGLASPIGRIANESTRKLTTGEDLAAQLKELHELHLAGGLTAEEFESAKRKLLDRQ